MKTSRTYVPTEADAITGQNVRTLRRLHGETLAQTIEKSGVDMGQSSLSRVELGQRPLSLPDATKLAAHWNTTPGRIIAAQPAPMPTWPAPALTEQAWLGNGVMPTPSSPELVARPLHAVPDTDRPELQLRRAADDFEEATKQRHPATLPGTNPNLLMIDLREPLTPEQYREQVWIPYLEARYTQETA